MTQASETTDLPVREPGRAVIIAAIHAYAEWLAGHPEVPAPHTVQGTAAIDPERLTRFADANGFRWHAGSPVALLTIVAYEAQGVMIEHGVVAAGAGGDL
jgi:hypothetical protein